MEIKQIPHNPHAIKTLMMSFAVAVVAPLCTAAWLQCSLSEALPPHESLSTESQQRDSHSSHLPGKEKPHPEAQRQPLPPENQPLVSVLVRLRYVGRIGTREMHPLFSERCWVLAPKRSGSPAKVPQVGLLGVGEGGRLESGFCSSWLARAQGHP